MWGGVVASDVIIMSSLSYSARLLKLAKRLGRKIVLDMYISPYETYVLTKKKIILGSAEAHELLEKEQYAVKKADRLIFLSQTECNYYLDVIGRMAMKEKAYIVPLFSDDKEKALLSYWNPDDRGKLVLCWTGAEGNPIHGLDIICGALRLLEQRGVPFEFHILGEDEARGETYYRKIVQMAELQTEVDISYDKHLTDGTMESFLAQNASIMFGLMGDMPKARNVISNKSLGAIAMKIPLIQIDSPAMREYFDDSMVYYCKKADSAELCDMIIKVMSSGQEEIKDRINKAYLVFEKNFSYRVLRNKVCDVLDSL